LFKGVASVEIFDEDELLADFLVICFCQETIEVVLTEVMDDFFTTISTHYVDFARHPHFSYLLADSTESLVAVVRIWKKNFYRGFCPSTATNELLATGSYDWSG